MWLGEQIRSLWHRQRRIADYHAPASSPACPWPCMTLSGTQNSTAAAGSPSGPAPALLPHRLLRTGGGGVPLLLTQAQRRIPVQQAKQMLLTAASLAGQSTVSAAEGLSDAFGVMPIIFSKLADDDPRRRVFRNSTKPPRSIPGGTVSPPSCTCSFAAAPTRMKSSIAPMIAFFQLFLSATLCAVPAQGKWPTSFATMAHSSPASPPRQCAPRIISRKCHEPHHLCQPGRGVFCA